MPKTSKDDDKTDALPVTAEVGDEGGSYADPTVQVATREGGLPRIDQSPADVGATAGAVSPSADGPADGVRGPAARGRTGDYSATKAPENRPHVETETADGDPSLRPGGAQGAGADVGMSGLDRDPVPSKGSDLGHVDYGTRGRGRHASDRSEFP